MERPEDASEDSLERLTEGEIFLPLTSESVTGPWPTWMLIPMPVIEDIVGKVESLMVVQDMIVVLRFEGKMSLFAIFPLGTTMQDGGMRKRSNWNNIDVNNN